MKPKQLAEKYGWLYMNDYYVRREKENYFIKHLFFTNLHKAIKSKK